MQRKGWKWHLTPAASSARGLGPVMLGLGFSNNAPMWFLVGCGWARPSCRCSVPSTTQDTGRRITPSRVCHIHHRSGAWFEYIYPTTVDLHPHSHRLHRRLGRMVQVLTLGPIVQHRSHAWARCTTPHTSYVSFTQDSQAIQRTRWNVGGKKGSYYWFYRVLILHACNVFSSLE